MPSLFDPMILALSASKIASLWRRWSVLALETLTGCLRLRSRAISRSAPALV